MSLRSGRRPTVVLVTLLAVLAAAALAHAAPVKSRVVLIAPFDASTLDADDRWVGEAVGEILLLALVQHQAFIPIERARVRTIGVASEWSSDVVQQAARNTRADLAVFGRVTRTGSDL